jgi:hypothetical protein
MTFADSDLNFDGRATALDEAHCSVSSGADKQTE